MISFIFEIVETLNRFTTFPVRFAPRQNDILTSRHNCSLLLITYSQYSAISLSKTPNTSIYNVFSISLQPI